MPAASIDLTAKNTYGDNYGNFAETNTLPWSGWTRARHIKTSAIGGAGGNGACATVGYKIMAIPSFTLITRVMGLVKKSASATMSAFAIGDADASTTWLADLSGTALGPPTEAGIHASLALGGSVLGPSHLVWGKYYSNGGEIQFAAKTSEKTLEFMVVVQGVTFSPA